MLGGDDGLLRDGAAGQWCADLDGGVRSIREVRDVRNVDDLPDLDIDVVLDVLVVEEGGSAGLAAEVNGTAGEYPADLGFELVEQVPHIGVSGDDLPAGDNGVGGDGQSGDAGGARVTSAVGAVNAISAVSAHQRFLSMVEQCEGALAPQPELGRLLIQAVQVLSQQPPPGRLVVGEVSGKRPGGLLQAQARLPQAAQHEGRGELVPGVVPVAVARIDVAGAQQTEPVVVPQHPGAQERHAGELADGPPGVNGTRTDHVISLPIATVSRSRSSAKS